MCVHFCTIPCFYRGVFGSELFLQSQLIIVGIQLRGFEKTTNFGETLSLSCLRRRLLLLLLLSIQLSIVTCKFFERDEEIAEVELESVGIIVKGEQSLNESLDLDSVASVSPGPRWRFYVLSFDLR